MERARLVTSLGLPLQPRLASLWLFACLVAGAGVLAEAATPRWTTGPPYFNVTGTTVVWYTNQPLYYTDPGDLSTSVNHAAADAMVTAAASVWNVPTSLMVLQQGGTLNEQVSSANVYLGSNGLVFPADVQTSNYASKQIAVIYDRDGSVTDLLLGGSASDPANCLQHAVTESVDSITRSGFIQHAIVILNGRCTGAAPEKQLQMQYQLERVFGRVLGLGWSQLNDNVFTGTPQPTYSQALHWPIMHPIDVLCGPYTYQCLPDPFTLRDDDVSSISFLYRVDNGSAPAGKQDTFTHGGMLKGDIRLANNEGMAGVNIVIHRNNVPEQVLDTYEDVSAVTGIYSTQLLGNPITPKPTTMAGSFGANTFSFDIAGFFYFGYIPIADGHTYQDILLQTQPINPLYTGDYAVAPYTLSTVNPSGDTVMWRFNNETPYWDFYREPAVSNAAGSCSTSAEGTESAPTITPATGWWNSVICGSNSNPLNYGHTSWVSLPVLANRSFTVEMTALDESGYATGNKVRPVIGVWRSSDAVGSRPGMVSAGVAFNSVVQGMTTATAQTTTANTVRIAFSSETGDGRPDYNYQARVLYSNTITPAIGTAGTQIVLSGRGFRPGNTVTINGITASVANWTSTTITATVPRLASVPVGATAVVDVAVTDLSTHGTTVMSSAFQYVYSAPVYLLQVVSAPGATQIVGLPASPAFTVKVIDNDGVTPLPNAPVVFSSVAGSVSWAVCTTPTCTVLTDASGQASIAVTALAPGAVTLQAAAVGQTQQVSFQAVPLVRTATLSPQYKYLAAGAVASWVSTASFTQQGQPAPQTQVVWATTSGHLTISAAQTATSSTGTAQATIQAGPIDTGAQATGTVCAWGNVCATITALGVDVNQLQVLTTGNGTQAISSSASFLPVTLQITDAAGNPVAGAIVHIHQATRQWTMPCSGKGRCPVAPTNKTTDITILSDSDGNLSVVPLDMGGPEVTSIVVATGSKGYASLTLQRQP